MNDISGLKVQLRGLNGDYNNIDYNIEESEFLIGRHFDCDLVLKEKTVSGKHAKIVKTENHFEIEDLDSSNGTFVNKEKVKKMKLRTEDVISIDKVEFRFINPIEVARTIISDGEDFRRFTKTLIRNQSVPKIINKENPDTTPFKIKEIEDEIKKKFEVTGRKKRKPGLFYGLSLSLIMAFVINIGFVLLLGMIRLANVGINNIWSLLKAILSGFPLLHMHTYWSLPAKIDLIHILSGICIPMGLILAGLIIQRSSGGGRFRNAFVFSFFYVITALFAQFSALSFNFKIWLNINSGVGLGITNASVSLLVAIAYFWVVACLFSFIGTLFSKNN